MKKIISLLFVVTILLTGCSLTKDDENTPTRQAEIYLDSYKNLDDNVMDDLTDLVENMESYTSDQRERYHELMKNHYSDMKYEIKSETIDGDNATVEVEIEVLDYSNVMSLEPNMEDFIDVDGNYDEKKYYDSQLDMLESVTNHVKYTIVLDFVKEDDNWKIVEPNEIVKQKIHGIYTY